MSGPLIKMENCWAAFLFFIINLLAVIDVFLSIANLKHIYPWRVDISFGEHSCELFTDCMEDGGMDHLCEHTVRNVTLRTECTEHFENIEDLFSKQSAIVAIGVGHFFTWISYTFCYFWFAKKVEIGYQITTIQHNFVIGTIAIDLLLNVALVGVFGFYKAELIWNENIAHLNTLLWIEYTVMLLGLITELSLELLLLFLDCKHRFTDPGESDPLITMDDHNPSNSTSSMTSTISSNSDKSHLSNICQVSIANSGNTSNSSQISRVGTLSLLSNNCTGEAVSNTEDLT